MAGKVKYLGLPPRAVDSLDSRSNDHQYDSGTETIRATGPTRVTSGLIAIERGLGMQMTL